jgi:pimeloyl-ACP methyl ester carboxylesterase
MLEIWSSMKVNRQHKVASLHGLLVDTRAWWNMQLASLPEQFDVLGFSLGAVLALQLLDIAPSRVRRLVLVGGNSAAGNATQR